MLDKTSTYIQYYSVTPPNSHYSTTLAQLHHSAIYFVHKLYCSTPLQTS